MNSADAVVFEITELSSGNVVNDFPDVEEALASIRNIAAIHGQEAVQNLALMRLEGDDQTLVAMQQSLVDLAVSMLDVGADSRAR